MTNLMDRLRRMAFGSAALAGGDAGRTDGQLLDDYLSRRDEAAVSALVRRHGAMVWGVCRRVLRNHHDAEDAFQATFLVLVRRAASVSPREMVGNWLYGVAHQTALKARATTAKRQARERQVTEMPEPAAEPEPESWQCLEPLLDQELSRLPAKYRGVIVLCDLEGKTRKQVARPLKILEGTLSSRLTTARKMLARRLARHRLAISGGALAAALAQQAVSAAAPVSVTLATIKTATLVAAGTTSVTGAVPVKVAALTEGVLKAMLLTKLKIAAVLLLAATATGAGLLLQAQDRPVKAAPQPPAKTPDAAKPTAAAGRPFLDQAVRATADVKDTEQKARLLILVARAQAQAGERTAALATLRRAADLGASLPNNDGNEFNVRGGILASVIDAQAELEDTTAALKTLAANVRPKAAENEPKDSLNSLTEFWQNSVAACRVQIAVAQLRAGKAKEAEETARAIDAKQRTEFTGPLQVETAVAPARAGKWQEAQEAARSITQERAQVRTWLEIAKLQAKASMQEEAGASVREALRGVPPEIAGDTYRQGIRAICLQQIALMQADVEDVKSAIVTAETIPELPPVGANGEILQFPYKHLTLAMLRARAGDYDGAKAAARAIDAKYSGGWQRGYGFRVTAAEQARAKKLKDAFATADAIEHVFHKACAYIDIAQAQAGAGDRHGAAKTFDKALELADAVAATPDATDLDRESYRPQLLQTLAAAQAEAGQQQAALAWIARLSTPNLRARALVGVAEGIAYRAGAKRPPPLD